MCRRLVVRANEWDVFLILCLHIAKVLPCLRDLLRTEQEIEYCHRLNFCAGCYAFVRNGGRHGNRICPVMAGQPRNI